MNQDVGKRETKNKPSFFIFNGKVIENYNEKKNSSINQKSGCDLNEENN